MSYKAAAQMTPIFCLLHLTSDATLAIGDPVPFVVQSGSSGHGVTTSSGVVTVPSGYQWFCQGQVLTTSIIDINFDWYVGGSASTTFTETGVTLLSDVTKGSNSVGHAYIDASGSGQDVELRASAAGTVDASITWLMLTGYPS